MLKKTIVYKDFNGNEQIEDFYFNLTKAELFEIELLADGKKGISSLVQSIMENEDREKILETFKFIARKAIGKRSEDGKRFVKNQDIIDDFMYSEAYSELFLELMLDHNAASSFINNIVPKMTDSERAEMAKKIEANSKKLENLNAGDNNTGK